MRQSFEMDPDPVLLLIRIQGNYTHRTGIRIRAKHAHFLFLFTIIEYFVQRWGMEDNFLKNAYQTAIQQLKNSYLKK